MPDDETLTRCRVLVVEDDERIGVNLARALTAEGYGVDYASTIAGAREVLCGEHASSPEVSLVLLDIGLPDGDGVEFCRQLRTLKPSLNVILLTARSEEIDVVVGFDAGATDYVTKPFRLGELLARVRSRLRTANPEHPGRSAPGDNSGQRYEVGDIAVDPAQHRAFVGGCEVALRAKEFDLLSALTSKPGVVWRREELMSQVWDENWWGSTKTLDVHIGALRRRLGETSPLHSRIVALRGIGYRFEPRS